MAKGEKIFLTNSASAFKGAKRRARIDEEKKAKADFQAQAEAYKESEVLGNIYADAPDFSENLTNTFEDLTVNQQQAEFQATQFRQSLMDVASTQQAGLGGAGFGSFTTNLARQAQIGAQQASASIGQQEAANQMAAARGEQGLQLSQMQAAQNQYMMQKQGEEAAYNRQVQRQETLLAMAGERAAAATAARQQNTQMWLGLAGNVVGAAGSFIGAGGLGGKEK